MPRWLPPILVLILAAATVAGAFAWVEYQGAGSVSPGVELAGRPVGQMSVDELIETVQSVATSIESTPHSIRFAGRSIETDARTLGVVVDRQASARATMAAGRRGSFPERLVSWLTTVVEPRRVEMVWTYDTSVAQSFLEMSDASIVAVPEEPKVTLEDGEFVATAGVEGLELDRPSTVTMLENAFSPEKTVTVDAPTWSIPTKLSTTKAVAFADHLNDATAGGVTAVVSGRRGRLSEQTLRSVLRIDGWPTEPTFSFQVGLLQERLIRLFADVAEPGSDPVMEVVDDEPRLVEAGTPPRGCCDPAAGQLLIDALAVGDHGPVEIPTVATPSNEDISQGRGVIELVGEFTTKHQCCASRVENIHRIADLVRGVYLQPGERFSVNDFIGPRTRENGFVSAGVIEQGRFTDDVGGGISQFATTLFNAAFFAGMELEEYQSHSIYISRYPYGREATLSFPKPDLVIRNSSEYPVLIWSSYDDTSITMSIYSTKHIEVEETGQETRSARRCTQVETFRRRTYPNGNVIDDSVTALYRPSEGLDCNGNPTPERRK